MNAPINDTINAKWSYTSGIDMYIHGGVAPNKIYAGLPLYGRVWTLTDPSQTAPGSPGTAGIAGRCTAEVSLLHRSLVREWLTMDCLARISRLL